MINVTELNAQARRLPLTMPEFTPNGGRPVPSAEAELSAEAKSLLAAWKPLIEKADWANAAGTTAFRKQFELTTKLVLAQMLTNAARLPLSLWQKEATMAGTDLPSYARQIIGTILRAYPRLFALQLFGVVPFNGPDGRIFFRDVKYDTAYNTSAPNIAQNDRTDDLTKFNKGYFKVGQGEQANKLKISISSMVVTVDSYRVVSDWYYEGEDDYAALYGGDLGGSLVGEMSSMLQWVTDRTMIDAALAAVPAGNTVTWTAQPTGYDTLPPTEKRAYDESIWAEGIIKVISAITTRRAMTTAPNWAIASPDAVEKLMKLTTFVPVGGMVDGVDLNQGPIRDVGVFRQVGIRVLVDPQMATGTILFGRRPTTEFDPALQFCPYRPLRVTGTLEQPGVGSYERGVYSRFGVAVPNTVANPASSQLADVYGKLVIA